VYNANSIPNNIPLTKTINIFIPKVVSFTWIFFLIFNIAAIISVPPRDDLVLNTRPDPIPANIPPNTLWSNISFTGIMSPIFWVKPNNMEYNIILIKLNTQNDFSKYINPNINIGMFIKNVNIPILIPVK